MNLELLEIYKNLITQIDSLKATAKEQAKIVLDDGVKEYFAKYSELVESIFWNQYTPWHNDGEACEFSVGDIRIVLKGDEYEEYTDEGSDLRTDIDHYDDELAKWAVFNADPETYKNKIEAESPGYFGRWHNRETWTPCYYSVEQLLSFKEQYASYPVNFVADTQQLLAFISSIDDDIMEELFGNHITVTITADGTTIEEYNHD